MTASGVGGAPASPRLMSAGPARASRVTLLAVAAVGGLALGDALAPPVVPCLVTALLATLAAWCCRRRPVVLLAWLLLASAALGAGWIGVRARHVGPDALAARHPDTPATVDLAGTALAAPQRRPPPRGSMAVLAHRDAEWSLLMRVEGARDRSGRLVPCRGRVRVRGDGPLPVVRAGDRVTVRGMLYPPRPARNPGAFDGLAYARRRGEAGVVVAAVVRARPPTAVVPKLLRARADLRAAVRRRLHGPAPSLSDRTSLLDAVLLGRRDERFPALSEAFRRVGLAHLLAVSGMHLGILVGLVLAVARLDGQPRRRHGLLAMAVVAAYLAVVELRLPVLRAGAMLAATSVGMATGRRVNTGSLVALSGLLLLAWNPQQLFDAGFQLSYGVVLGLLHLAPALRRRWFGPPDRSPPSLAATVGQWLCTGLAVSCTAWLVATPIALHHFGLASPLGAPLSVVALPPTAIMLATGYARALLGPIVPYAAPVLDVPLHGSAEVLLQVVRVAGAVPGSAVHLPPPSAAWALAGLGWVVLLALSPDLSRWRRAVGPSGVALVLWLAAPLLPNPWAPALRIDMLDVGDGSCYVLRSGGATAVFDAGSAHRPDVGAHVIVPALRALGVRRVDAVVVSHANVDHCGAMLEVVDGFATRQALVTAALVDEAVRDPATPAGRLLAGLRRRGVPWRVVGAGDTAWLGDTRWRWLHPGPDAAAAPVNETSMVIALEAAGRRVVLCGDVEGDAAAAVLAAHPDLRADVVELPHHGADDEAARALVRSLRPSIAMQSTGRTRWERDVWKHELRGATRLVTARDGACRVAIGRGGRLRWERFLKGELVVGVRDDGRTR